MTGTLAVLGSLLVPFCMQSETVIQAPRTATTVTTSAAEVVVVGGEELQQTGERSLPQALGRAAGVWVQESNLGGGAPVIRGLLGNQILILVDGVRLNDSTTRLGPNESLNSIDPAIVERVEVFLGTASVLYGSDAIGGVIAIWTRSRAPAGKAEGANAGLSGGAATEYDSAVDGGRASLDLSFANASTGLLGVISGWDFQDLEVGGGEQVPFTGYHGHGSFAAWEQQLDAERSLRFTAQSHRNFDVPRTFNLVPGFGQTESSHVLFDFKRLDRRRFLLTYDDRSAGVLADHMQVRVSRRDSEEQRLRQRRGSDSRIFEQFTVATTGLGIDWQKDLGDRHRVTYGLDFDHDDVDSFSVETDLTSGQETRGSGLFAPEARYDALGLFVQDEITDLGPYALTLGARYSYFDFGFEDPDNGQDLSDQFDDLTLSASLARPLSESVNMSASLSQGFQAPNLEDLANDGEFAGGTELANPTLDPARSLMGEIALDVLEARWQAGIAVFATRIDDLIGRRLQDEGDPDVAGDELYLRDNVGRLDLYGAEISGERELLEQNPAWTVRASLAYVRGRQYDDTIDPNSGERPLERVDGRRIPPLNAGLALAWNESGFSTWLDEAELSWRWADRQDRLHPEDQTDPRIDPEGTSSWDILNLDVGGPLRRGVRWSAGLHNLFDEEYRVHGSGVDGPGRAFVLGLNARF